MKETTLEQFRALAANGEVVPVCREIPGDMDTPVSVLERFVQDDNIALLEKLAARLKEKHPETVAFTRSLGFSMGIGIQKPDGTPDLEGTFKILFRCYETGLIVISVAGNILRIQPPLNIEPELLEQGFAILDRAMEDFEAGRIGDEVLAYKAGW